EPSRTAIIRGKVGSFARAYTLDDTALRAAAQRTS
ncbi:MAG: hypothetical protein H6R48_1225, partial [Proteobacteria bacterium]|nr:hypothetical protein [Pseudomonadota bacterium]